MIKAAEIEDMDGIIQLVEGYYAASPVAHQIEVEGLQAHIQELVRPENDRGGLLVAIEADQLVGFAFLFYGYDKRALRKTVILNDLYVAPAYRRRGIARALIEATFEWAKAQGARQVTWQTRTSNAGAQHLYDQLGERETGWIHYYSNINE